jgi:hypothetical protein
MANVRLETALNTTAQWCPKVRAISKEAQPGKLYADQIPKVVVDNGDIQ